MKTKFAFFVLACSTVVSALRASHSEISFVVPQGYHAVFNSHVSSTMIGYVDVNLYNPNYGSVADVWSMLSPAGLHPSSLPGVNVSAWGIHEDFDWIAEQLPAGDYFVVLDGGEPYYDVGIAAYSS